MLTGYADKCILKMLTGKLQHWIRNKRAKPHEKADGLGRSPRELQHLDERISSWNLDMANRGRGPIRLRHLDEAKNKASEKIRRKTRRSPRPRRRSPRPPRRRLRGPRPRRRSPRPHRRRLLVFGARLLLEGSSSSSGKSSMTLSRHLVASNAATTSEIPVGSTALKISPARSFNAPVCVFASATSATSSAPPSRTASLNSSVRALRCDFISFFRFFLAFFTAAFDPLYASFAAFFMPDNAFPPGMKFA